jgi:hypothetical protein
MGARWTLETPDTSSRSSFHLSFLFFCKDRFRTFDYSRRCNSQDFGQTKNRPQGWTLQSSFQQADVRAVQPSIQREPLLGQLSCLPDLAQSETKGFLLAGNRLYVPALPFWQQNNAATLAMIVPRIIVRIL